jgi:hypothetical protein
MAGHAKAALIGAKGGVNQIQSSQNASFARANDSTGFGRGVDDILRGDIASASPVFGQRRLNERFDGQGRQGWQVCIKSWHGGS